MRPINILLVEDNEGDILLTLEAFNEISLKPHVDVVRDGQDAVAFLRKEGRYAGSVTPQLVLLDINMPGMSGIEVLDFIKRDPVLHTIPVVMLTTSSGENDIKACYERSANCFITKPIDFGKFLEVVQSIEAFWLKVAQLPNQAA